MDKKRHTLIKVVVATSSWDKNPYIELFIAAMNKRDVIAEHHGLNRIFPLPLSAYKWKPDVLHLQDLFNYRERRKILRVLNAFLLIGQLFLFKVRGARIVWTIHLLYKRSQQRLAAPPIFYKTLSLFLDAIISHFALSEQERKLFPFVRSENICIVPHPNYIGYYENSISQAEARKRLGISSRTVVFLSLGFIHIYKGIFDLIDAFKKPNTDDRYLLIVGHVYDPLLIERIKADIGDSRNIRFILGIVPDDEVQLYVNACDCVVVSHKVFTTSGVIHLAASFARPCIAPCRGYFKQVLGGSRNFLYDPDDRNGLANAIEEAVKKRDALASIGNENFIVAKQWDWDRLAERSCELYHKLIS